MKRMITVYTLISDTSNGIECELFPTARARDAAFRDYLLSCVDEGRHAALNAKFPNVDDLRDHLDERGDLDDCSFRPDEHELEIEID